MLLCKWNVIYCFYVHSHGVLKVLWNLYNNIFVYCRLFYFSFNKTLRVNWFHRFILISLYSQRYYWMHSKLFLLKNYVKGVSVLSRINLCLHRLSRKHLPNAFPSRHFQLLSETNLAAQRPYAKHYSLIINNFLCIIFPMFSSLDMLLHSTKLLNFAKILLEC